MRKQLQSFVRTSRALNKAKLGIASLGILLGISVGSVSTVKATHMAGSDITYTWNGGNSYTFQQKVYRDCAGVSLAASLQLTVSPASPTNVITLTRQSFRDITPLCPGQASRCQSTSGAYGIEEHIFTGTVNLNPNTAYSISSNLVARNNAITTVLNSGSQNLWTTTTLNTSFNNSSPVFLNPPSAFLCAGQPATLSPNAFDPDGDAIQYELTPCQTTNGVTVPYAATFSPTNPLTTSGGLTLNPNTGQLNFTPTVAGQVAVICVKATEYRNGNPIGTIVRDIQVRVLNCSNTPPVISATPNVVVPSGTTYCLSITATDANMDNITLTATSGIIPPATFVVNSSSAGQATATFCFTPTVANEGNTYTVTINAQDDACPSPGTGASSFNITVPIVCRAFTTVTGTDASCGGSSDGSASGAMTGGTAPYSYSWTGPNNFSAFTPSINNLAPGQYCLLVVDGNSCASTACVTIGGGSSPISATASVVGTTCGQANGSITVTPSGGTAPFTYSLDGGAAGSSNTFTGLAAGAHSVAITDQNGCDYTLAVTVGNTPDGTAPVISCPSNITVGNAQGVCGANVAFNPATATDNCGNVTVAQTAGGASGSFFAVGTSTVTYTATDNAGNTASCSFTVTVNDTESPTISCNITGSNRRLLSGKDKIKNGASTQRNFANDMTIDNDPGVCGAEVEYLNEVNDNCSGFTVVQTAGLPSGSVFPVGTTTNSFLVTDGAGNAADCSFDVTVVDAEAPNAVCNSFSVNLDANGFAHIVASQVDGGSTDNCGVDTVFHDICDFYCQNAGPNTVTLTVLDIYGNSSTCTSTITVVDAIDPVAVCQNVTVQLDANGAASISIVDIDDLSFDNCDVVSYSLSQENFGCGDLGNNTVTLTVADAAGNTDACTATVTVEDNTDPVITCPANINVSNDPGVCGANVSYNVNATDNCSATVVVSPVSGSAFALGTTTVSATATDPAGNSVSCSFTVTVNDTELPNTLCNNLTVQLDANGQASVTAGQIDGGSTDNCGVASVSINNGSFNCSNLGGNTVTLTVVDVNGNSNTCTSIVTVEDNIAPSITCPSDIAFDCLRDFQPANTAEVSASDNCTVVSIDHVGDQSNGGSGCAGDPRIITRTYSATDQSGNTSTCTQTITIESSPVIADASDNAYVFPQWQDSSCATISVVGSGGCAPYTYSWSNGSTAASQSVCPTATTVYVVTVTDAEGCSGVDSVQICAIDLTCTGSTNNGQNGSGQSGNGVNQSGNAMQHIAICHVPPGNPNNAMTKCLPIPAAMQHVPMHAGDYLGACGNIATRNCDFGTANKMAAAPVAAEALEIAMEAFPNPFSNATTIRISLDQDADMQVVIYDLTGKAVVQLFEGAASASEPIELTFQANNLSAGTYVARLTTSTGMMKTVRLNLSK